MIKKGLPLVTKLTNEESMSINKDVEYLQSNKLLAQNKGGNVKNMKNIYAKLQQSRVDLQSIKLEKSGHNKFAGYRYFELGDFLPSIQTIFNKNGLCGAISFTKELATLTIFDTESDQTIVFTSPMSEAKLKGCHDIQNLGAVETYERRYLWTTALEIVENDVLDATTGKEREAPEKPFYSADDFKANLPGWSSAIKDKKTTSDKVITAISSRFQLTEKQIEALNNVV